MNQLASKGLRPAETILKKHPLSLLSIVAFIWISFALTGAGEPPLSEARASPSIAALPPSLNAPAGANARDLSEYVFLHETRNQSIPLRIAARANACSGAVRGARG